MCRGYKFDGVEAVPQKARRVGEPRCANVLFTAKECVRACEQRQNEYSVANAAMYVRPVAHVYMPRTQPEEPNGGVGGTGGMAAARDPGAMLAVRPVLVRSVRSKRMETQLNKGVQGYDLKKKDISDVRARPKASPGVRR
jgi:hypothetical protein